MKLQDIKKHWEEMGRKFDKNGKSTPTSRDPYLAELERKNIINLLSPKFTSLEIGCGDGIHTIEYSKYVDEIDGLDIAESLIKIAKNRASGIKNIRFSVGSVLNLDEIYFHRKFDCIISQRCLINLGSWENQKLALRILHSLLNESGILLITEGFDNELENLNLLRVKNNLEPIKVVEYNKNFDRNTFEAFITRYFQIEHIIDYGIYLFLSRLYHPLAVYPEQPRHDSVFNRIAMELSLQMNNKKFEEFSYNLFYVLRKKS